MRDLNKQSELDAMRQEAPLLVDAYFDGSTYEEAEVDSIPVEPARIGLVATFERLRSACAGKPQERTQ